MIPLVNYGVKCISMGLLMDEDVAAVWRGPMVTSSSDLRPCRPLQCGAAPQLVPPPAAQPCCPLGNVPLRPPCHAT